MGLDDCEKRPAICQLRFGPQKHGWLTGCKQGTPPVHVLDVQPTSGKQRTTMFATGETGITPLLTMPSACGCHYSR